MIEPFPCRVLPFEVRDGAANMAFDHMLLDAVDADPREAVFRTYGWSEPTLSLGYFQHLADARSNSRWGSVPLVRRPSGGGALWHDRELTYALVVPRRLRVASRPSDLYRAVHAAVINVVRSLGIPVARRGEAEDRSSAHPFLCFLDVDPEDILLDNSKIVGSAQRRRPNAVLQHGSILLARSVLTPELPGLEDLTGESVKRESLVSRLEQSLAQTLELSLNPGGSTETESLQASALELELYRSDAWTSKR